MKIIIIGAGFTGTQLAKRLINGKNDVVLIDNDEDVVRHASNRLDCEVTLADGNNLSTLEDAGIAKADALVCVTSSDEVNMITCSLVDSVYPKIKKIARVRNYAYYTNTNTASQRHAADFSGEHRRFYGIDFMIHPDVEAAEAIVNAVEHGSITDSLQFEDSSFEIIRMQVEKGSAFDGISVQNIRTLTDKPFLLSYIENDETTSLPSGSTILQAGNNIGMLLQRKDLPEFLSLCGSKVKEIKKIALVGAGRIGQIVAEKLITKRTSRFKRFFGIKSRFAQDFVIIEPDEHLAKAASEKFPGVKVFRADLSEEGFIEEEGLDKFDLVIYTTHNHELNIVMAAYIESLGVENSIALVSNAAFGSIARNIGIEVAVPLRDTVIDSIMSHLKGDAVSGIHSVNGGTLEIAELTISDKTSVKDKPLKEIAENGKFLVLMIKKQDQESFTIASGNTVLESGDKVVLIITSEENESILEKFS